MNQLSFALGEEGGNPDREPVNVWTVAADEVHVGLLGLEQESRIAAHAVGFVPWPQNAGFFCCCETR